jgi:hypothetical protein
VDGEGILYLAPLAVINGLPSVLIFVETKMLCYNEENKIKGVEMMFGVNRKNKLKIKNINIFGGKNEFKEVRVVRRT